MRPNANNPTKNTLMQGHFFRYLQHSVTLDPIRANMLIKAQKKGSYMKILKNGLSIAIITTEIPSTNARMQHFFRQLNSLVSVPFLGIVFILEAHPKLS